MFSRLVLALSVVCTTAASAQASPEFTNREYSELMLLLNQRDFDVRLAAKSLFRHGSDRQDVVDLFAEVTWTACSGSRKMSPDALSWLAKALGNTKNARYAKLLDFCLAKVTDKKIIKYVTQARGDLSSTDVDPFEGGKMDLSEIRAHLTKKRGSTTRKVLREQFLDLHRDQTLDEIYSVFGVPDDISGVNVPRSRKAGHLYVHVTVSDDMMALRYSGLGTIRFAYSSNDANWLVAEADCDNGPFWGVGEGRFLK